MQNVSSSRTKVIWSIIVKSLTELFVFWEKAEKKLIFFIFSEKKLKINKKKHPVCKSKRTFNTYCTYKWLDLFRKKHKIVEVIYFDRPKVDSSITRSKFQKNNFDKFLFVF